MSDSMNMQVENLSIKDTPASNPTKTNNASDGRVAQTSEKANKIKLLEGRGGGRPRKRQGLSTTVEGSDGGRNGDRGRNGRGRGGRQGRGGRGRSRGTRSWPGDRQGGGGRGRSRGGYCGQYTGYRWFCRRCCGGCCGNHHNHCCF